MPAYSMPDLLAALALTMHAVSTFDHHVGNPHAYRLACREMADAMDDLYAELHRPEYGHRLVDGSMSITADDEGLLHLRERGPWSPAWRAGPNPN